MIKTTITLLFFTLLFTACAERGSNLTLKTVSQKPIQRINTPKIKQTKTKPTHKKTTVTPTPKSKVVSATPKKATSIIEEPSFSLSDETQNKISGFLIIVIGLLILI
ncbi:MAG TPA: hypothetical protein ENJ34_03785 [Epsilonproteobacteria bacterium]|nr:hypothetical protein [Campylobacterota bacterium]